MFIARKQIFIARKPMFHVYQEPYLMSEMTYSRTSIARTSLGPGKFVRDMGNSSHWGLIMAQGQEANGDKLGISFRFSIQ